jgi:adenosylcobinamide kinase / adenosylcobinamide-phosphate guanylyltransferase
VSLVFLLGGARSGKTALAVRLARKAGGPVTVIATAEAGDEEMSERIRLHRADRPESWRTIEEPLGLESALAQVDDGHVLVIDCLTLWVANLIAQGDSESSVEAQGRAAAARACSRTGLTIAVSNEVGLGVVPATELGRRYRDVLGRVNAAWAEAADETALVVAGRLLQLSSADSLL